MVAEEAGVSVTIVSYVINDNRYVDSEKRERVRRAIKKLGYRPNVIARSLKLKQSKHILFVADRIDNEHFGKVLFEMDKLLYDKGYFISLAHNRNNEEFVQHTISRQFDGVVISSISIKEEYINALAAAGIPVALMMNREYGHLPEGVGKVWPGLYNGARECVRHLHQRGRRRIVYVDRFSKRGDFSDLSDLRLKGYVDEMGALGLEVGERSVISHCRSEEEVAQKVAALIRDGVAFDAVFGRNDRLASLAMQAVKSEGLRVPEDVSVIGFDNSNLSHFTEPPLTTMEINRKEVARALVEALLNMIEGRPAAEAAFETMLIQRESTT